RPLIAGDFPGRVPSRTRRIQANSRSSIPAAKCNFPGALASAIVGSSSQHRTLCTIEVQCRGVKLQEFLLTAVSQQVHQCSIGIEQLSLGRAEVNAFLQRFEEFGETPFLFPLFRHVASQSTYANHLVTFYDGV